MQHGVRSKWLRGSQLQIQGQKRKTKVLADTKILMKVIKQVTVEAAKARILVMPEATEGSRTLTQATRHTIVTEPAKSRTGSMTTAAYI